MSGSCLEQLTGQNARGTQAPRLTSHELARRLATTVSATRLALGEALEALGERNLFHELGFSSLAGYGLERTGRSSRWLAESRVLARKLQRLRRLRQALVRGELSWSRAEVLCKLIEQSLPDARRLAAHALVGLRHALELSWLFRGQGQTCLELGEQCRSLGVEAPCDADNDQDPMRCLTITVNSDDAWWFHAAGCIFRRVGTTRDLEGLLEALLAETQNTLVGSSTVTREDAGYAARDRMRQFLAGWSLERERICESSRDNSPSESPREVDALPTPDELRTWTARELDEHIVTFAQRLATRDFDLGRAAERVRRGRGWRQLGFASEAHYARDGLGISMSSLKQKRALARRLARLPEVAEALTHGQIGSVSAGLVARVATGRTERHWVERARQRTVKHLRQEVALTERALLQNPDHPGLPPSLELVAAALALEGAIASGRHPVEPGSVLQQRDAAFFQDSAMVAPAAGQTSVRQNSHKPSEGSPPPGKRAPIGDGLGLGKMRLKLRLRESTVLLYRDVSRAFTESHPDRPFFRSICQHFLDVWRPVVQRDRKYEEIYERDGYTCSSPVCERRDVTPHHLHFRSRGGGDTPENVISLCIWCHLEGIHAGRLAATPEADGLHWRIGRPATLRVIGRDKQPN